MSRVVRRFSLRRLLFTLVVVVLGVSGTLIGLQASAGAARLSPKAAAPEAAAPFDHMLCYLAIPVKPYKIPTNVVLKNQFTKADGTKLKPKITQTELLHCNPVAKYISGSLVAPINNPNGHLLCYPFTVPTQPTHVVQVTNQFGTATLDTGQPNALCLPTWKSLVGPPRKTPNEPAGVDHFTCYPVTYDPSTTSEFTPPNPNVSLQDEFSSSPVPVTIGNPEELCAPTTKKVGSKTYPPVNPAPVEDHYLCFDVTQTPYITPIWDENQFGTEQLNLPTDPTVYLCVPSEKTLLH